LLLIPRSITVVAQRTIPAGSEVANHYKDSNNIHMLYNWGFTQPGNTTDWIPGWTSALLGLPPFSSDALFAAAAKLWQKQQLSRVQPQQQQQQQQLDVVTPYTPSSSSSNSVGSSKSSSSSGSARSSSSSSSSACDAQVIHCGVCVDDLIEGVQLRRLVTAVSVLAFYASPMPGDQERLRWPEVEDGRWRPQEQLSVPQVLSYIGEKLAQKQQQDQQDQQDQQEQEQSTSGRQEENEASIEVGRGGAHAETMIGSRTNSSSSSSSTTRRRSWQYSSIADVRRQQQAVAALGAECRLLLLECETTVAEDETILELLLGPGGSGHDGQAVQTAHDPPNQAAQDHPVPHAQQQQQLTPTPEQRLHRYTPLMGGGTIDASESPSAVAAAAAGGAAGGGGADGGGDDGSDEGGLDAIRAVQCEVCAALEVLEMLEHLPLDAEPGLVAAAADESYLEELRGYVEGSERRDEMLEELEGRVGGGKQQQQQQVGQGTSNSSSSVWVSREVLLEGSGVSHQGKLVAAVAARVEQKLLLQTAVELCEEVCAELGLDS
jgi:hypothetical protein